MAIDARQFCKSLAKNNYLEVLIMPFELAIFLLNVMILGRIIYSFPIFPFYLISNRIFISRLLHSVLNY